MWFNISKFIITYRHFLFAATLASTVYLGYQGTKVQMMYDYINMVPKSDPDMIFFENFRKNYGEDGNLLVIGFKDTKLFKIKNFAQYQKLCNQLKQIPGVTDVIALPTLKKLVKDSEVSQFKLENIFKYPVQYQTELDSLLSVSYNQKFYNGLIFNTTTQATLIAVNVDKQYLNSQRRKELIHNIIQPADDFAKSTDIQVHYAGIPYVRYIMTGAFQQEFIMLLMLSSVFTCIVIFLFFRSLMSVFFTITVIAVIVAWTSGLTVLLGHKISILTGLLPALIVVISIPAVIYMFNKYHQEYRRHNNKIKAVARIIEKIGFITFITNANTAVGFFVLTFTDISIIKEFGLMAGLMSLATFVITLIVIPALFMYLPEPTERQLLHLDKKTTQWINNQIAFWVQHRRPAIYLVTLLVTGICIYGTWQIKAIGYMADDLPDKTFAQKDLTFFEDNFSGVMPLEVLVDMGKKKAVYKVSNLQKLEELESFLAAEPGISPPISILSVIKNAVQTFYNDTPENYRLPTNQERGFILKYFGKSNNNLSIIRSLVDTNAQVVRFSMKVADLGTQKMDALINGRIKPGIDSIFKDTDFKVNVTGSSYLFLKGNQFLLNDLTESMLWAFLLISLMMAFLFTDAKMIIISVIPNVIPMLMTAGIMGLCEIRLKISTAVIFSISFGITIDSTIHYLSKFKQEMKIRSNTVTDAVLKSLKESGVSMIYTSLVLIAGFCIFMFSDFKSTVSLGFLICLTLIFAILTNMVLLPALLITFVKKKNQV
ncbi:MAG: MMPL family transporter [Cytophagales bacterium]|nr:MMPL family transporter [Cytophagales bacterium]